MRSVVLAIALVGCNRTPSYPGPAQALLGGGVYAFIHEPLCASVPIIHGPQGGYHIWGSVRARYLRLDDVKIHFTLEDADSGNTINVVDAHGHLDPLDPAALSLRDGLLESPSGSPACADGGAPVPTGDAGVPSGAVPGGVDGWGERLASTVFLPPSWSGCQVHACADGRRVRMRAQVTDPDGRTASDERVLVPSLDPALLALSCVGDRDAGVVPADLAGLPCN